MSSNYSNFGPNFRSRGRYYPKNTSYHDKKFYPPQSTVREVEISSISQTEPSKPKEKQISKSDCSSFTFMQNDITETKDEINHTYSKQDITSFALNEDYHEGKFFLTLVNDQVRLIMTKLDEIDFPQNIETINTQIKDSVSSLRKATESSLRLLKDDLNNKLEHFKEQNSIL